MQLRGYCSSLLNGGLESLRNYSGNSDELTVAYISKEELSGFVNGLDERYETSYEYLNVFNLRGNQ